jgi:hypothetical protein
VFTFIETEIIRLWIGLVEIGIKLPLSTSVKEMENKLTV